MERCSTLMDWENKYCENGYITKNESTERVNAIPTKILMSYFIDLEK